MIVWILLRLPDLPSMDQREAEGPSESTKGKGKGKSSRDPSPPSVSGPEALAVQAAHELRLSSNRFSQVSAVLGYALAGLREIDDLPGPAEAFILAEAPRENQWLLPAEAPGGDRGNQELAEAIRITRRALAQELAREATDNLDRLHDGIRDRLHQALRLNDIIVEHRRAALRLWEQGESLEQ